MGGGTPVLGIVPREGVQSLQEHLPRSCISLRCVQLFLWARFCVKPAQLVLLDIFSCQLPLPLPSCMSRVTLLSRNVEMLRGQSQVPGLDEKGGNFHVILSNPSC